MYTHILKKTQKKPQQNSQMNNIYDRNMKIFMCVCMYIICISLWIDLTSFFKLLDMNVLDMTPMKRWEYTYAAQGAVDWHSFTITPKFVFSQGR